MQNVRQDSAPFKLVSGYEPVIRAAYAKAAIWLRRLRTRRRLRELEPRLMADVGITEAERRRECAKWFWQG
ncbi:MAG: DUF1127 domain-containing protein [Rhodospirillales bacterium]|nr:DUF1127 domain-containing protein [Rhodospirillales bacterium]